MQQLAGCDPDIVILDLTLAQGTGFEVLRGIRQLNKRCETIVYTGHDAAPFRAKAEAEGAHSFVSKAHSSECLLALLRSIVTRAGAPDS